MKKEFLRSLLRDRKDVKTILFLFLLNILLKSVGLTTNCLSLDEPFSVFYAQMGVKDIVHELLKGNNPPLWEIVLHFWIGIFGTGVWSVRFLPLLFSSLTAVYVFKTGKKFFSYKTGLAASLLFSLSNYPMFFSHEARVYPLFCLLTAVSVFHFLSFVKQPGLWRHPVIFTLVNILICYAHYFGFFVLFTEFLWAAFCVQYQRKVLYIYLLSLSILLAAYIPVLHVFLSRFSDSVVHGTWLQKVKGDVWFFVPATWTNNRVNRIIFLLPLLGSLVVLVLNLFGNYRRYMICLMVYTWFWIPFLLMYFISFKVPMFLDRYLIYISPAFFLMIPVSLRLLKLTAVWQKRILFLFVVLMIVSFRFNLSNGRDVDKIAANVRTLKKPGTPVYFCPPWFDLNLMYYYDRNLFEKPYSFSASLAEKGFYPIYNSDYLRQETLTKKEPLIYIDFNSAFIFSDSTILKVLNENYSRREEQTFQGGFTVYYFHEK